MFARLNWMGIGGPRKKGGGGGKGVKWEVGTQIDQSDFHFMISMCISQIDARHSNVYMLGYEARIYQMIGWAAK